MIHAGNRRLLGALEVDSPELEAEADRLAEEGKTPLFFRPRGRGDPHRAWPDRGGQCGQAYQPPGHC